VRRFEVTPTETLGHWNGIECVSIEPDSIEEHRVHAMTHGWGPAVRPVIRTVSGFVRRWHATAETKGSRESDENREHHQDHDTRQYTDDADRDQEGTAVGALDPSSYASKEHH
jgi:hypothetical protein